MFFINTIYLVFYGVLSKVMRFRGMFFFVQQKKVIFWSLNTKWQLGHFESWDYYYTAAAPCVSVRRKVPCDLKKCAVPSIDELNQVFFPTKHVILKWDTFYAEG